MKEITPEEAHALQKCRVDGRTHGKGSCICTPRPSGRHASGLTQKLRCIPAKSDAADNRILGRVSWRASADLGPGELAGHA